MAIWAKKSEAEREAFATTEIMYYPHVIQGNNLDPGTLMIGVSTGALKPKSFVAWSMAMPMIQLIHSMESYVYMLGQPGDLLGHTIAFVGKQEVKDQL